MQLKAINKTKLLTIRIIIIKISDNIKCLQEYRETISSHYWGEYKTV